MKKRKIALWGLLTALLLAFCFQTQAPAEWQRPLQPSLAGGNPVCLSRHPLDPSKFLVANHSQLFEGSGASGWKMLWSNSGRGLGIEKILTFPWVPEYVFLITSDKVFMGKVGAGPWQPVYENGDRPEKSPLSFAVMPQDPNQWLVGTSKGLWMSQNAGKTWAPASFFSASSRVTLLFAQGSKLFIGDENSLFLSLNGSSAREVLTLPEKEAPVPEPEKDQGAEVEDAAYYLQRIYALAADDANPQHFFVGTHAGAFESQDGGYHWRPLSRSGMQSTEILSLAYASKARCLFAATPRGIYQYRETRESWEALSEGLAQPRSRSIAVINGQKLVAVTGDGFVEYQIKPEIGFAAETFEPSRETLSLFRTLLSLEPTAREIHKRVIRYADVGNWKIKRWHAASRLAGLLPSFSFGKDYSVSNNIDVDRGGTSTPDLFISGPNDVDKGWDARVGWDFGDVIYSSDQTSIDSREKLMVELRQDLLSEATRIYFERRRLQTDIVYSPSLSEQEHLERLLRLDELTSLLDAMTDGFLSKKLETIYEKNPELERLWKFK